MRCPISDYMGSCTRLIVVASGGYQMDCAESRICLKDAQKAFYCPNALPENIRSISNPDRFQFMFNRLF